MPFKFFCVDTSRVVWTWHFWLTSNQKQTKPIILIPKLCKIKLLSAFKHEFLSSSSAEYQQPLMLGTDTVSRKGSTFRPMDTDAKDVEATSHYDHLQTGIQYALPLTNQEPEYATPIIERHAFRKDPFLSDPSYSVPGVVLNKSPSFRAVEGSNCRKVIGGLAGGYQTPQVKGNCTDIYDSPKICKPARQNGSLEYQRPHLKPPVQECYSTPRDCVRLPFTGPRPDPEGSSSDGTWAELYCDVSDLSTKSPPDSSVNLFVCQGCFFCILKTVENAWFVYCFVYMTCSVLNRFLFLFCFLEHLCF